MQQEVYRDMARIELQHWWFRARTQIVSSFIEKIFPKQTTLEILDLGCGSGNNGHMLAQFGNVDGIEPEEFALEMAQKRGRYRKLTHGAITDPTFRLPRAEFYDLIIMTDVLEHIEKDKEALQEVYKMLKPGGRLLLTVPALRWLWSSHDWRHLHFRRYTVKTLRATAVGTGLDFEYVSYFNFFMFPLIALIRILKRLIPRLDHKPDTAMPSSILNEIFYRIFAAEKTLLERRIRFPIGVSIVAVLQKPSVL